jgi:hypothetical protein
MAAGLGFKDFVTGEVLTAADVDGYLMQNIWVFASTAARDAAVTAPAEGNFAFTKDTDSLWYYNGAAWVASGATGDIEGVTAGTGISGGGTSGTVTITNSMATAIDAKGDLVVGTGADTFSKLTVGANGTTLVADSAEATGLKWAAASGGSTYAVFRDKKSSGTASGTFTAGAWRTRVINDTLKNDITGCSIASNQITLAAGTYAINATCGGYNISRSQTRFYNITDSAVAFLGHSDYTIDTNNTIISNLAGLIVITGSKTFEVQHYATQTQSTNGFGVDASITDEIYLTITIAKVA